MKTPKARPLVSFDWAAKKILRDKANFDILEGFLTTLLKQEIKIISILESESTPEHATDKFNKVDLLVENQRGELIIIEIQNNREVHYLERLLYGASKLIVDHLQLGESYEKVKKVISISILYFLLGEGESDYVYHGSTAFYGLHDGSKLVLRHRRREALVNGYIEVPKNIFPEYYLIEVERFQDLIKSDLDEWIYFFKNSDIKEDFKSKNIQRAKEKLDLLKMPENERKAYEKYMMNKASERDVIESAKIEGIDENKKETAWLMLAGSEPLEKIKRYTSLSETEILELKSKL
jgi:predicted transposase/invertase (TIGR01784 family)